MRVLAAILVIVFVAIGVLVGALNADVAVYDFGIAQWRWPNGAALLGALLLGWLLGGLTAWIGLGVAARKARRRAGGKSGDARP